MLIFARPRTDPRILTHMDCLCVVIWKHKTAEKFGISVLFRFHSLKSQMHKIYGIRGRSRILFWIPST
jgi:hypothetical protein